MTKHAHLSINGPGSPPAVALALRQTGRGFCRADTSEDFGDEFATCNFSLPSRPAIFSSRCYSLVGGWKVTFGSATVKVL